MHVRVLWLERAYKYLPLEKTMITRQIRTTLAVPFRACNQTTMTKVVPLGQFWEQQSLLPT